MIVQLIPLALVASVGDPPVPPLDELLRRLNADAQSAIRARESEAETVRSRQALWPRPVFSWSAVEDAQIVYRPPQSFVDAVAVAHDRYVEDLAAIEERVLRLSDGSADSDVVARLEAELIRPASREFVMFPGIDNEADAGSRAAPGDPRWTELAQAKRRIAIRNRAVWIELRSLNLALISEIENAGAECEFAMAPEFVSRVVLNVLVESFWSLGFGGMPAVPEIQRLLPPLLGSEDASSMERWSRIAVAAGDSELLVPIQLASQRATELHDAAVRNFVLRCVRLAPSAHGFSGLGGFPTAEESDASVKALVERWLVLDHYRAEALEEMELQLSTFGEYAALVVKESLALNRLAVFEVAQSAEPIAVSVGSLIPESSQVACKPWLAALSELSAAHLESLYILKRNLAVEKSMSAGARSSKSALLEQRISNDVERFEATVKQIVSGIEAQLDPSDAAVVRDAGVLSILHRRPGL